MEFKGLASFFLFDIAFPFFNFDFPPRAAGSI